MSIPDLACNWLNHPPQHCMRSLIQRYLIQEGSMKMLCAILLVVWIANCFALFKTRLKNTILWATRPTRPKTERRIGRRMFCLSVFWSCIRFFDLFYNAGCLKRYQLPHWVDRMRTLASAPLLVSFPKAPSAPPSCPLLLTSFSQWAPLFPPLLVAAKSSETAFPQCSAFCPSCLLGRPLFPLAPPHSAPPPPGRTPASIVHCHGDSKRLSLFWYGGPLNMPLNGPLVARPFRSGLEVKGGKRDRAGEGGRHYCLNSDCKFPNVQ